MMQNYDFLFCEIDFQITIFLARYYFLSSVKEIFSLVCDSRDSVVRLVDSNVSNTLSSINFNHQMTLIINRH